MHWVILLQCQRVGYAQGTVSWVNIDFVCECDVSSQPLKSWYHFGCRIYSTRSTSSDGWSKATWMIMIMTYLQARIYHPTCETPRCHENAPTTEVVLTTDLWGSRTYVLWRKDKGCIVPNAGASAGVSQTVFGTQTWRPATMMPTRSRVGNHTTCQPCSISTRSALDMVLGRK